MSEHEGSYLVETGETPSDKNSLKRKLGDCDENAANRKKARSPNPNTLIPNEIWHKVIIEIIRNERQQYPETDSEIYNWARNQTDCPAYGAECIQSLVKTLDVVIKALGHKVKDLTDEEDEFNEGIFASKIVPI